MPHRALHVAQEHGIVMPAACRFALLRLFRIECCSRLAGSGIRGWHTRSRFIDNTHTSFPRRRPDASGKEREAQSFARAVCPNPASGAAPVSERQKKTGESSALSPSIVPVRAVQRSLSPALGVVAVATDVPTLVSMLYSVTPATGKFGASSASSVPQRFSVAKSPTVTR